jgi:hypothetical protein
VITVCTPHHPTTPPHATPHATHHAPHDALHHAPRTTTPRRLLMCLEKAANFVEWLLKRQKLVNVDISTFLNCECPMSGILLSPQSNHHNQPPQSPQSNHYNHHSINPSLRICNPTQPPMTMTLSTSHLNSIVLQSN